MTGQCVPQIDTCVLASFLRFVLCQFADNGTPSRVILAQSESWELDNRHFVKVGMLFA